MQILLCFQLSIILVREVSQNVFRMGGLKCQGNPLSCSLYVPEKPCSTLYFLFWVASLISSSLTSYALISSSLTSYVPHVFLLCFLLSCSLEFPAFSFVAISDLSAEAGILKAECLKAPKATESVIWFFQQPKCWSHKFKWQESTYLWKEEN